MNPVVVGATICASPMQPISVLESDQDFCVDGPICVGDSSLGKCPGPQEGLEFGAFCGKLSSGVYGCHKLTLLPPQTLRIEDARLEAAEAPNCTILPNLAPVNVKDIGMLCAQLPICAGNVNGNCPVTLTKLEETYRCEFVDNAYQCVL
uniref:Uncharacterized protein n=1 Tax=Globisporangium ultimum (strain ATCC 200006 / CBS 805.95 / DAOM BR144) TaxID=431595 RepID=K3WVU7_GLOUD